MPVPRPPLRRRVSPLPLSPFPRSLPLTLPPSSPTHSLFDRMFGIGIQSARSWGALTLNGLSGGGGYGRTFGAGQDGIAKNSARYFVSIDLKDGVL